MNAKKIIDAQGLINTIKQRFEKNMNRHKNIEWSFVEQRILSNPEKLWSLSEMERTGGEPDVVGIDKETNEVIFFDCSEQSPSGRRSICYDDAALKSRKQNKPETSAMEMATNMGTEILNEDQYRYLQTLGNFDTKTSSWIFTPESIRKLGGALFCDRRYNQVFTYHNGAESYYASRGFRAILRI